MHTPIPNTTNFLIFLYSVLINNSCSRLSIFSFGQQNNRNFIIRQRNPAKKRLFGLFLIRNRSCCLISRHQKVLFQLSECVQEPTRCKINCLQPHPLRSTGEFLCRNYQPPACHPCNAPPRSWFHHTRFDIRHSQRSIHQINPRPSESAFSQLP